MKKIISIALMVLVLMGAFTCIAGATYEDAEYLQSLDLKAPEIVSVKNGDYGVYITFKKVEHVSQYNVYMKVKGGSWQPFNYVVMEETDDKMVVLDQMHVGKKAGTTYYYTVKGFAIKGDGSRETPYDKTGKSVKYIQAPYPSNVYNNHSGNKFSWSKVNGADGYYIYRKTPSSSYKKIATIKKGSTTSYTDKNIKAGQTYIYTAKAYKGKLVSSYFKNGITISNKYKVESPVITTKNVTGGKRLYLSSNNSQDVIFYKIGKDGTYKQYQSNSALTSTKTIYAYVARTECYKSPTVSKKVVVTKAKAPTISVANTIGGKKITLKTTTPTATLYYKTSKPGSYTQYTGPFVVSSTKTVYAKTLAKGYVSSSAVSKKISVSKVSTPTLSSVSYNEDYGVVTLKWKAVKGAQGYEIYRKDELNSTYVLIGGKYGNKATTYYDYDYTAGLKNSYKIRAYCSGKATSSYSNVKTVGTVARDDNNIMVDPLSAYQNAAQAINQRGIAGYTKKSWQRLEHYTSNQSEQINSALKGIIQGFMTTEADAESMINEKGSEDAMLRMPASDCSREAVRSATAERLANGNYKIVIVMKDQVNPSYDDSDGLGVMSKDFLDYKDVLATVENDSTVATLVKNIDGTITYKGYTITAEMTADGKLVSITHYGVGATTANITATGAGIVSCVADISFSAKYTDFIY